MHQAPRSFSVSMFCCDALSVPVITSVSVPSTVLKMNHYLWSTIFDLANDRKHADPYPEVLAVDHSNQLYSEH